MAVMNLPLSDNAPPRRRAVVSAAAEVLAEHGPDAPFELIAQRAGIERAALARHFPDRVVLTEAVLRQYVEDLADRTRSWAGEADVFLWFVEQLADFFVRVGSLPDVLRAAAPETLESFRHTIIEVGGRALRDAQMEGLVRTDVTQDDITMIAALLGAGLSGGGLAERRAVSLRTRAIVLSGLKAQP
jgi:AcrR family transcriptional regulator